MIGTARKIPTTPNSPPPKRIPNITQNGFICSEPDKSFGCIRLESSCCRIIIETTATIASVKDPVNTVITPVRTVAVIAPKYGIRLNAPSIRAKSGAYLTPSTDRIINEAINMIIASTSIQ